MCFDQNQKTLHNYYEDITSNDLAVIKGYFLNKEDIAFGKYVLDISCKAETKFDKKDLPGLKFLVSRN